MSTQRVQGIITAQYGAALKMLSEAIVKCPEMLWLSVDYPNKFWHIAYHAVFYTDFYLHESEASFVPWAKHRVNYNYLGAIPRPPYERPMIDTPYSKNEVLEYHEICSRSVDERVRAADLDAPSGFHWLEFNRLGVHFYNIRHLQHHTGQLIDRLRTVAGLGVRWARAS
jgi:DinB superfamily